jgi:hypothetical protein
MPGWKWFLVFVALLPGCAKTPPPPPKPKPTVIYLDRCSDLILRPGRRADKGVLLREIVRQGFLLAAREEFGLTTRDAWLSDPIPSDVHNPPFDIRTPGVRSSELEVRWGFPGVQTLLGKHPLVLPVEVDYKSLLVDTEELSRTKFVEMLRKAGFEPGPRQKPSKLELPKQIESRLAEMTFAAQSPGCVQGTPGEGGHGRLGATPRWELPRIQTTYKGTIAPVAENEGNG